MIFRHVPLSLHTLGPEIYMLKANPKVDEINRMLANNLKSNLNVLNAPWSNWRPEFQVGIVRPDRSITTLAAPLTIAIDGS
ncbi:hypothetical protein Tco_0183829 [Tanacetum coccineum]